MSNEDTQDTQDTPKHAWLKPLLNILVTGAIVLGTLVVYDLVVEPWLDDTSLTDEQVADIRTIVDNAVEGNRDALLDGVEDLLTDTLSAVAPAAEPTPVPTPAAAVCKGLVDEGWNARRAPDTDSEIVETLPQPALLSLVDSQGEWYEFQLSGGQTGWIDGPGVLDWEGDCP